MGVLLERKKSRPHISVSVTTTAYALTHFVCPKIQDTLWGKQGYNLDGIVSKFPTVQKGEKKIFLHIYMQTSPSPRRSGLQFVSQDLPNCVKGVTVDFWSLIIQLHVPWSDRDIQPHSQHNSVISLTQSFPKPQVFDLISKGPVSVPSGFQPSQTEHTLRTVWKLWPDWASETRCGTKACSPTAP